jgi:hypothetical protein
MAVRAPLAQHRLHQVARRVRTTVAMCALCALQCPGLVPLPGRPSRYGQTARPFRPRPRACLFPEEEEALTLGSMIFSHHFLLSTYTSSH